MHLSYLILDWSRNGVKSQKNCSQNCPPIPLTWEKLFSQMSLFGGVVRRYELPQTAFMCSYSSLVELMATKMPCWNGSMASLRSFPTKLMFDTIFFHLLLDFKLNFLVETIGTPVLYSCVLHSWVHWKDIYLISFVHCDYCAKPSVNCLNCLAKNIFTVVHKSFCPWVGEKLCKAANTRWRCQPLACSRCKSLILWQSWISCPSLANISRKDSLLRM